jgi:hypothetical protein
MRNTLISIAALMTLVAVLALDFAVMRAIPAATKLSTRIGLFGVLPMANALAVFLVIVVLNLITRREIAFSRLAFLFVGGIAVLLVVYIAMLAPVSFLEYIDLTAGPLQDLIVTQEQQTQIAQGLSLPPLHAFGMERVNFVQALLACTAVTPLILVPALLAGVATRGYHLKLLSQPTPVADGGA